MHVRLFIFIGGLICRCPTLDASYRLHDTNPISGGDGPTDCLIEIDSQLDDSFFSFERSPESLYRKTHHYCRRSPSTNASLLDQPSSMPFEELRQANITARQLYHWNAPFDVIENYVAGDEHGTFANCSDTLWFGASCEYTVDDDEQLYDVVDDQFSEKANFLDQRHLYTNGTCYEMINSSACGSILCLDWREICDGK